MLRRLIVSVAALNLAVLAVSDPRCFSSVGHPRLASEAMERLVGGECPDTYSNPANCQVNQNPDYNPCAVSVQDCKVSADNAMKCISVQMTTPKFPRCFEASTQAQKGLECKETAQPDSCATLKTGDVVDGKCSCPTTQGTCGAGTYKTEEKGCTTG